MMSVPGTRKASIGMSGRKEDVNRSMPLRESTNDLRLYSPDKVKSVTKSRRNIEEKHTEEVGEDTYNYTTNEISDLNLVMQKLEEARRHMSMIEQESRDLKENEHINESDIFNKRGSQNMTLGNMD